MAFPKSLRLQLGLSQPEFANLLDTNAGQLSMAESGLRNLPTASLEIANALEKAVTASKMQATGNKKTGTKAIALLTKKIRSGELKLELLKMQEEKVAEKLDAARRLLAVAEALALPSAITINEDLLLQMAVLQRKGEKKIAAYEAKQIQLQLAIASTEAVIAKAKELAFY